MYPDVDFFIVILPGVHQSFLLCVNLLSCFSVFSSLWPMDSSPPGSLSMGFSRQEYWCGLPCPFPGGLPDTGIEHVSSELNSPIPVHFSSLIPRMLTFTLAISCWPLPVCLDSWTWHSRFLCNIALYSIGPCFYHQSHPQLGIVFALAPSLHSFWCYFSTDLQ